MDKRLILSKKIQFDAIAHTDKSADIEFWYARELMPHLGYERWENIDNTIIRAMDSCAASEIKVCDHYREITKLISTGKGAHRSVKDYILTRYGHYISVTVIRNLI